MARGFLCIDKPAGKTSRGMTTAAHKHFKPDKVGHVGTLDPLATGLQVIAIGTATRLSNRLHEQPKEYIGRFVLGVSSNTEDISGTLTPVVGQAVTRADLERVLPNFLGTISQTPPAFSAARVNGRRAYDLARAGRPVELPARSVDIYELEFVDTPDGEELSEFGLRIRCGSGTYIRSLGRDIAIAAGSGAVMRDLRRTKVGPFDLSMAMKIEDVDKATALIDCQIAVGDLNGIELGPADIERVRNGNALRIDVTDPSVAMFSPTGQLLAIAEPTALGLQPRVVLPDAFDDAE